MTAYRSSNDYQADLRYDGDGPITGTASLGYGGAATATGVVAAIGVATLGYGGGVASAGTPQAEGTSALLYGGVVAATGTVGGNGTVVLAYGGSASAAGTCQRLGVSTTNYSTSLVAVGLRIRPLHIVPSQLPIPRGGGRLSHDVAARHRQGENTPIKV